MENERKLAHIEKIEWIRPIENADNLLLCGILGWQCVITKKDNFKIGDLIVYCEIDSVLPERPEFEFLRSKKFRIKTIRLRGEISQGLVLPLTILPLSVGPLGKLSIGQDVTEALGITKYLTPSERHEIEEIERKALNDKNKLRKFMMRYSWFRKIFLSRTKKDGFPYWISKTDETRIQSFPHVLEQFKDKDVYVTEKVDFQSVSFTGKLISKFGGILGKIIPIKKYKFIVCMRRLTTNDKNTLYWKIARKYNIEEILKKNPHLTIQGEQGDTKVQGNKYGIKEPMLWVFNIIDHQKNYHYDYDQMKSFCDENGLQVVPLVKKCKLHEIGTTVDEVVKFSNNKSIIADIPREGVVVRCIENGKKILSFKAINPNFLLKYDE